MYVHKTLHQNVLLCLTPGFLNSAKQIMRLELFGIRHVPGN